MAETSHNQILIDELTVELSSLCTAAHELNQHLASAVKNESCLNQIKQLRLRKNRALKQVDMLHLEELSSQLGATEGGLVGGIGILLTQLYFSSPAGEKPRTHPFFKLNPFLNSSNPYGQIRISLKEGSNLDQCKALSISKMARESRCSEAQIVAKLRADGYRLLTIPEFIDYCDNLIAELQAQIQ